MLRFQDAAAPFFQSPASFDAAAIRAFVVQGLDKQDGKGIDWRQAGELLFKVAFNVLDELPDDQKSALARRVHEGSYTRMMGGFADGSSGGDSLSPGVTNAPANKADLKAAPLRPQLQP